MTTEPTSATQSKTQIRLLAVLSLCAYLLVCFAFTMTWIPPRGESRIHSAGPYGSFPIHINYHRETGKDCGPFGFGVVILGGVGAATALAALSGRFTMAGGIQITVSGIGLCLLVIAQCVAYSNIKVVLATPGPLLSATGFVGSLIMGRLMLHQK